jgi:2-dehydro-3-deoxyphosphooctonate aldolase (KDO 8-P synthase)
VSSRIVHVGSVRIGGDGPLALIAGPCVIEDERTVLSIADRICRIADDLKIPFVFKASYAKDNRSSPTAYYGPGLDAGLAILEKVRRECGVPVLSDVHCQTEVEPAAQVLDILQIPAYLSQQTNLALTVGKAGKPVNIKKGQFVAPEDMVHVVAKVRHTGNDQIILTERGSCFGYRRLVVDMRSFPIMRSTGCPVIFDATHAVRLYGAPSSDPAGAEPQFVPTLARAAVAAGCDGVFIETHTNPQEAKCDACSMMPIDYLHDLLKELVAIREVL